MSRGVEGTVPWQFLGLGGWAFRGSETSHNHTGSFGGRAFKELRDVTQPHVLSLQVLQTSVGVGDFAVLV